MCYQTQHKAFTRFTKMKFALPKVLDSKVENIGAKEQKS